MPNVSMIDGHIDEIKKTKYIDVSKIKFSGQTFTDENKDVYIKLSDVVRAVEQMPAEDVEEVVRCKDCVKGFKRTEESKLNIYWCDKWQNIMRDSDFCSFGEQRRLSNDNNTI